MRGSIGLSGWHWPRGCWRSRRHDRWRLRLRRRCSMTLHRKRRFCSSRRWWARSVRPGTTMNRPATGSAGTPKNSTTICSDAVAPLRNARAIRNRRTRGDVLGEVARGIDLDHIGADRLEWEEEFVNRDLRLALDRLGELGLTLKSGEDRYTTEPKEAGSVTLTPLGTWVVQRSLSELVDVPVAGALASVNAGELLRRVGDLPEDVGVLELRTWVERRGDSAAKLLVDAVVDSDETARLIGFRALTLIGPSASAEVATLERHQELGAYATVWQVDAGLSSVEDLDSAGEPQRFVRLLYVALALWVRTPSRSGWYPSLVVADWTLHSTTRGGFDFPKPRSSFRWSVSIRTRTSRGSPARRSSVTVRVEGRLTQVEASSPRVISPPYEVVTPASRPGNGCPWSRSAQVMQSGRPPASSAGRRCRSTTRISSW